MKKLLAILVLGLALAACSHNESTTVNGAASAPEASAPAAAPAPEASAPAAAPASEVAASAPQASAAK